MWGTNMQENNISFLPALITSASLCSVARGIMSVSIDFLSFLSRFEVVNLGSWLLLWSIVVRFGWSCGDWCGLVGRDIDCSVWLSRFLGFLDSVWTLLYLVLSFSLLWSVRLSGINNLSRSCLRDQIAILFTKISRYLSWMLLRTRILLLLTQNNS